MSNYTTLADEDLLQHLYKGDEEAFAEIYNRYWNKLLAIGFFYSHDKQAAEDIVHDVMMSLWVRKNSIQISSLDAYLTTAVKFAVFKNILRDKKRKQSLNRNADPEYENLDEQLDARFLQEYLNGIVERFPEKTRLIFVQSRQQELSVAQIAKAMDLSPKAVEYHITKALKALKNSLTKIKSVFI